MILPDPVIVGGKELEVVDTVKLLGVTISSSLSWNFDINEVIEKISRRLNFLAQLKRSFSWNVDIDEVIKKTSRRLNFLAQLKRAILHVSGQ